MSVEVEEGTSGSRAGDQFHPVRPVNRRGIRQRVVRTQLRLRVLEARLASVAPVKLPVVERLIEKNPESLVSPSSLEPKVAFAIRRNRAGIVRVGEAVGCVVGAGQHDVVAIHAAQDDLVRRRRDVKARGVTINHAVGAAGERYDDRFRVVVPEVVAVERLGVRVGAGSIGKRRKGNLVAGRYGIGRNVDGIEVYFALHLAGKQNRRIREAARKDVMRRRWNRDCGRVPGASIGEHESGFVRCGRTDVVGRRRAGFRFEHGTSLESEDFVRHDVRVVGGHVGGYGRGRINLPRLGHGSRDHEKCEQKRGNRFSCCH